MALSKYNRALQSPHHLETRSLNKHHTISSTMAQASRELAPSDRILRHINILVFIPGLAFLIATGLTSGTAIWPFVGIAPLALSAIVGFLILLLRPRSHAMVTLTDLGLACFHLAIAIWGWAVGRGAEVSSSQPNI